MFVKKVLEALLKVFKIKDPGPLKYFVVAQTIKSKENDTIWMHQLKLMKKILKFK
jgi:hypothetical protein